MDNENEQIAHDSSYRRQKTTDFSEKLEFAKHKFIGSTANDALRLHASNASAAAAISLTLLELRLAATETDGRAFFRARKGYPG
jgi:hypothetical protein